MPCCRNKHSCGDGCDRFCPCISSYPNLCTVFLTLLIAAVIAAVFAAYTFISLRLSIFRFSWSTAWFIIINSSFFALVAVVLLLLLALSLWFVCSTYRKAVACKVFYILALNLTMLLLAAALVGAIAMIYGAKKDDSFFARELEVVWMQEINDPESTLACRVQAQLKCQGFEEADCQRGSRTQNFSRCATNCRPEDEKSKPQFENVIFAGCRDRISSFYIKWNAVLVAGAGAATILCFVAWFVTCCSVSFEKEV